MIAVKTSSFFFFNIYRLKVLRMSFFSVRVACTTNLIHYTNHSGLCNQIYLTFSGMFIKDNAVWGAEQD
jgi:hypothetical protein